MENRNPRYIEILPELLDEIRGCAEFAYPDEGAGLLLGKISDQVKIVEKIMPLENTRESEARRRRYLLTAKDYARAEIEAARSGLEVLGVFHSHPDHPAYPSEFDRQWAMPWFSYLITSVNSGQAEATRSWRLEENRSSFYEEAILQKMQE
jgi:proteasome lid subunit RPN8/RPN11